LALKRKGLGERLRMMAGRGQAQTGHRHRSAIGTHTFPSLLRVKGSMGRGVAKWGQGRDGHAVVNRGEGNRRAWRMDSGKKAHRTIGSHVAIRRKRSKNQRGSLVEGRTGGVVKGRRALGWFGGTPLRGGEETFSLKKCNRGGGGTAVS